MAELTLRNPTAIQTTQQATQSLVIARSRPAFFALCLYILTNAYLIPVLQVGPSWSIWPALPDFALAMMGLAILIPQHARSEHNRFILILLFFISIFMINSYLLQVIWMPMAGMYDLTLGFGVSFGLFAVYRVVQFMIAFYAASYIPMTQARIRILDFVVLVTLVLVVAGIIATFYDVVTPEQLAGHITDNGVVGGQWTVGYKQYKGEEGLGTIGYNHAYTASQVLLLISFYVFLAKRKGSWLVVALMGISLFAVFVTGSRSGLVAYIIWMGGYIIQRPRYMVISVVAGLIIMLLISTNILDTGQFSGEAVDRQATLTDINETTLSGRTIIWEQHINILSKSPSHLVFGRGLGSAMETGSNSHQNYLQIIMETGLIGLAVGAFFCVNLLTRLWDAEPQVRTVFWATIGLLVGATNVETFYPVSSGGHFLNLYVVVVAVVLAGVWKSNKKPVEEQAEPATATNSRRPITPR